MATMKTKSVGFNIESDVERELLEFANKIPNFSGYVKQLMMEDIKRSKKPEIERTPSGGMKLKKN